MKHLPVPKWAPSFLTPNPAADVRPSAPSLKLLQQLVERTLASPETYTVTASPVLCPEGKNHLFVLKPYFWEIAPGQWGKYRTYNCDLPAGQRQLQSLSEAVHTLALGARFLPDMLERCSKRAEELVRVFFVEEETRMDPRVMYAQCNPGEKPLRGDRAFIVAVRYLILVTRSLPHLHLPTDLDSELRSWFEQHLEWMTTSQEGADARAYGNNITTWYHAVVASHLTYLDPPQGAHHALDHLHHTMTSDPTPSSFFAPELARTRPRHYVLFALEPTFILASLSCSTGGTPPAPILAYLRDLVSFARDVQGGAIEAVVEGEERYEARLSWFKRMLRRWDGEDVGGESGPDGKGWEGGWTQRARMLWGMI